MRSEPGRPVVRRRHGGRRTTSLVRTALDPTIKTTPTVGDLSDDDFDVGTNSYTIIVNPSVHQRLVTPGALDFTLQRPPYHRRAGHLVLHIGGAAFRLSEATVSGPKPSDGPTPAWTGPGRSTS